MTREFIVLFLLLLLPVMIWAQNSVIFDFSSSSRTVQNTIEKDGMTLKFSGLLGKPATSTFVTIEKDEFIILNSGRLLTIESKDCLVTSVAFVISDVSHLLKLYNKEKDQLSYSRIRVDSNEFYKQPWNKGTEKVAFTSSSSRAAYIKSIVVIFNKDVSLAVSFTERTTLYYSDRSFIIPKGVVARTYKIGGNVLSRSQGYKRGDVLPGGTTVVLETKEGKYIFEKTSKMGEADPYNALHDEDIKTIVSGGEVYYVFGKGRNGVGFYWKKASGKVFTTEAHKAHLVYIPSKTTNAKSLLSFGIALEIQDPMVREKIAFDGLIYSLPGQRVDKDYKGVIIINGKKYLNG